MNVRPRIGKIKIADVFIEKNFDAALAIMQHIVPIRAEYMYDTRIIEYVAISNEFDVIEEGWSTPSYDVFVTINPDTLKYLVKFVRVMNK